MSKLVVILGATGKQGGSVVDAFLLDPGFKVKAVARDLSSAAATKLREKGVEVVQGNVTDLSSLVSAFKGAHYIYAVTPDIGVNGATIMARGTTESVVKEAYRLEIQAGQNIIHAADDAHETLRLLIFSALSAAKELSVNYYKDIYHFDAKAALVQIIEKEYPRLAEKTVALQLGMFATNWKMPTPLKPAKQADGRFRIQMPCSASTKIPFIDPHKDPAIFVKALASQPLPKPANGRSVRHYAGYSRMTTFEEWVRLLNDLLPIEVYYEQVSMEQWAREVTIIPGLGMELAEMWQYCEKVGYFGGEAGSTRKITELHLADAPAKIEEFIKEEDWSILYNT